MRNGWRAASLLLLLAACGPADTARPEQTRKPLYFDLKGFLDGQTILLNQRKPAVEKQ